MQMKVISTIKTKAEARNLAIDWQSWQSNQSMSYLQVSQWHQYFLTIAKKFNLVNEFKENWII